MDDIVGRWNSLRINEEEEGILDDSLLSKGVDDLQSGLVGKVLTKKPFNKRIFKEVMERAWKVERGLEIRKIGPDMFVFSFGREREK
ncbi:hypothetical protein TorRG33x02_206690 [Trema orientale]|uniref:Uncharacterized protein n=1 Tax=Trema orientale TaxID=63057 RepID=A0A2P5EDC1_TREOI|nr:hypothetical protein TorRG33x02_206690 [Trema orientale]